MDTTPDKRPIVALEACGACAFDSWYPSDWREEPPVLPDFARVSFGETKPRWRVHPRLKSWLDALHGACGGSLRLCGSESACAETAAACGLDAVRWKRADSPLAFAGAGDPGAPLAAVASDIDPEAAAELKAGRSAPTLIVRVQRGVGLGQTLVNMLLEFAADPRAERWRRPDLWWVYQDHGLQWRRPGAEPDGWPTKDGLPEPIAVAPRTRSLDGTLAEGPVVALDIDGVCVPVGDGGWYDDYAPPGFLSIPRGLMTGRPHFHPRMGEWLDRLDRGYRRAVWMSSWVGKCRVLAEACGSRCSPDWPLIPKPNTGFGAWGHVAPDAPLALVDDTFDGPGMFDFIAGRPGPTLVVVPNKHTGMGEALVDTLLEFAADPLHARWRAPHPWRFYGEHNQEGVEWTEPGDDPSGYDPERLGLAPVAPGPDPK